MYDRIIAYVKSQPWAIRDRELAIMRDVLRMRAAGVTFTAEELAERIGTPEAKSNGSAQGGGGVAVVPVWGIIGHRANELRALSSGIGTSTEVLGTQIATLAADPTVKAIVLDINSPGGGVFGLPEVAQQIREARSKKPVVAVANALTASAAYWIATQATEIVVTPSAQIGSVGVFSVHEDHSQELATAGIGVTVISAGKYKTEQNPFAPLSEEARAAVQAQVDSYYAMFTKDVAKGRGVSVETVRNGFGEGRTVNATEAVRLGMADRVGTLDDVIMELATGDASAKASTRIVVPTPAIAAETPSEDAVPEADRCATCRGSGLKPERYMSDPQGQENCPDCSGTGKKAAASAGKQVENEPAEVPAWQADIDRRKLKLRILELG